MTFSKGIYFKALAFAHNKFSFQSRSIFRRETEAILTYLPPIPDID